MEETLTGCLVRVREDLSQLKKVRNYLETNADTEEHCSVTWRTIEAFNSILSVCSSQNSPENNALDTLLDSFFYLARNNTDNSVWDDFGFELGIICVKVLSAIERTNIFEVLFCKLLSIISIICEFNPNIWKTTARQILNVLINKKITLPNLETILKLYICTLKHIDNDALCEFSSQNFHLLKTLSLLVHKIGDFEIQSNITEVIYLHLPKDKKLMSDIFEKKLFQITDFENDCRLYLNSLNKSRRGCYRKVYSICCHVLYFGGYFVEPPVGRNSIWVDANKDTERVSIKCSDSVSEGNRIMYIPFSKILNVQFEKEKTEGNLCLTIKTKKLEMDKDVCNDICLVTENVEGVFEFVQFLESEIGGKKKKKTSKTMDSLVIDRNSPKKEVQDSVITSSERPGIDQILPDVLSLFEKANQATNDVKPSQTKSQELSPNSFIESLNKHIGLGSPESRQTFEDSIETVEFLQKSTPGRSHKLFRSPNKIFNISETKETDFSFVLGEDKENNPPKVIKTYSRKPKAESVLKGHQHPEVNSQSQDFFRGSSILNKKPYLPRLKRSRKAIKKRTKDQKLEGKTKQIKKQTIPTVTEKPKPTGKSEPKPSLLDPNGYTYQRWCKPTTSERSNFWLKKLDSLQKPKTDPENVFDFSDESDSIFGKSKRKRVVHSKRKCRTKKRTKQTSLREVKEILKKASPIREKETPSKTSPPRSPEVLLQTHVSPQRITTPENTHDSEYESLPSEDEEPAPQTKKRDRSDEETSSAKGFIKKKPKISLPKNFLSSLRRRLEKIEEKDRRYTDEIIRTVDKATNHLFNHIQRKDGEQLVSYLKTAEGVSIGFETELEDLNLRAKRIQRAVLYFKAGCSVGEFCEFLNCNFTKVREGLRGLQKGKDTQKTIERICERLSGLIGTEIEKSFKAEWILKRNRLLKCASILGNFDPET